MGYTRGRYGLPSSSPVTDDNHHLVITTFTVVGVTSDFFVPHKYSFSFALSSQLYGGKDLQALVATGVDKLNSFVANQYLVQTITTKC